jgi:hypothetical protein
LAVDRKNLPLISFGDALRAASDLGPFDAEAREAILGMLGLRAEASAPAQTAIGPWKPSSTDTVTRAVPEPLVFEPQPGRPLTVTPPGATPGDTGRRAARTTVTRIGIEKPVLVLPDWMADDDRLGSASSADAPPGVAPPAPLFGSRTERAILIAALATMTTDVEIDVPGLVERLAEGRPIDRVPMLATFSVRRGADILVDLGAGLDPFRSDIDHILQQFDAVLADDRLRITFFSSCPPRSAATGPAPSIAWSATRPRTPVVVLTDLGIGGPLVDLDRASSAEWLEFACTVRAAHRPLIAIVPYEAGRWPAVLARAMTIIHWSERTTAGEVRRAIREAQARM